jgi:hypothetical protein
MGAFNRISLSSSPWTLPIFLNLFIALHAFLDWPIVKLSGIKQALDYGDLRIILRAADCYPDYGAQIYLETAGSCLYNYGQPLIWSIRALHLNESHTDILGIFLFLLTTTCFSVLMRMALGEMSGKQIIFTCLLFCSPPVMLLFERGNIDSLIFSFLCVAIIASHKKALHIQYIFVALASLYKFYTLPLLYFLLLQTKGYSKIKQLTLLVTTILISLMVFHDVRSVLNGFSIPNPMSSAYGSSKVGFAIGRIFEIDVSKFGQLTIGLFLTAILLVFALLMIRKRDNTLSFVATLSVKQSTTVILFSQVFLVTWFTGMSYIYRLVLVIPVFIILTLRTSGIGKTKYFLVLTSIWLSPWFGGLELIGDFSLIILSTYLTGFLLIYLKKMKQLGKINY